MLPHPGFDLTQPFRHALPPRERKLTLRHYYSDELAGEPGLVATAD